MKQKHAKRGWQDKSAHGVRRLGGCFCWVFWRVLHRAGSFRAVRFQPIALKLHPFLHGAGPFYG